MFVFWGGSSKILRRLLLALNHEDLAGRDHFLVNCRLLPPLKGFQSVGASGVQADAK